MCLLVCLIQYVCKYALVIKQPFLQFTFHICCIFIIMLIFRGESGELIKSKGFLREVEGEEEEENHHFNQSFLVLFTREMGRSKSKMSIKQ